MTPEQVKLTIEKGRDASLDGHGLFFEGSLPRGEEEDELRVRECAKPFDGILRIKEEIPPYPILERGQFPSCSLWTVTQNRDARCHDIVKREGDVESRRRRRRCICCGKAAVVR